MRKVFQRVKMIKILIFLFIVIECRAKDLNDVDLCFYEKSLANRKCLNLQNVKNEFKALPKSFYDDKKENLIFVMGWQPGGSNASRDEVLGAFFAHKRDEYNIAEVDWSKYVVIDDPTKVLPYINPVISNVNQIISEIYKQGFKTSKTYAIGETKALKNSLNDYFCRIQLWSCSSWRNRKTLPKCFEISFKTNHCFRSCSILWTH